MKQKGYRFKLFLLVFTVLSLVLAGCKPKSDDTLSTDEPVTLIWWNLFEPVENVRPLIEAYQSAHSNVTIQYAERDLSDYRTLLESNLTDGLPRTGPDIFTIHNTWTGNYESFLSPAPSSVVDPTKFRSDFYDFVSDDFTGSSGLILGIPLGIDCLAIIYNKDLLEAEGYTVPSSSWDDFKIQARTLTTRKANEISTAGFSAAVPENTQFAFEIVNLLMLQSGGNILSSDKSTAVFATDSDIFGALSFYLDFAGGNDSTWNNKQQIDIAAFLSGKLAMYAAPSWRLLDVVKYNEQYNLGLDYATAPMPQLENLEDTRIQVGSYWGQVVSRDSANPDVAWDFLNFITQPDQLRTFHNKAAENRAFGELYPRREMASELTTNEHLKAYVESFPFIRSWKMVDGGKVKKSFDTMLETSLNGNLNQSLLTSQNEVNSIIDNKGKLEPAQ
ncbi:extracellular solute-binding protein [Candidatus Dojkabacteria bacterium]|nr:extracellular solute-binding protein [Candidatus Dojkabacteria bacterium]